MRRFKDLSCSEKKMAVEKSMMKAINYIANENGVYISLIDLDSSDCISDIVNEIARSIAEEAFYPEISDTVIKL